jgi:alkylation response protein AidB-like acyl-CoA dehydrogenase
MSTEANADKDGYILSGEKVYVPFAAEAREMIVYANLGGITQGFIVPLDRQGITVEGRQPLMGVKALPVYRVLFDKVRVPGSDRLGAPDGHDFSPILDSLRVANAALGLGVSRAAFEYSRDYAKEREAFGMKIAQKQAIAFMLAEMATEIEAIRLLTWEAAWMIDSKKPEAGKYAYLATTGSTDMAMMVTDRAVQILGGHGYIREHPVELWMRNGRGIATFTGLSMV